jgi:putative redox protein
MATIHSRYLGNLRTEQKHLASGSTFQTDAPTDNQGKGELFSPTDTVCAALSSCMMTLMGIAANTHSIPLDSFEADVTKVMASGPRRISQITIRFYNFPKHLTEHQQLILERAARTCPVALSVHSELIQDISFEF